MNLKQHYTALWEKAFDKFKNDQFDYDPMLDDPSDNRMGLTLLAYPDIETRQNIGRLLDALKKTDPSQYYYPLTDIHVTVLSIISCTANFQLEEVKPERYIDLLYDILSTSPKFNIAFKGITASSSCIMIQGFPLGNQLNLLRDSLREKLKKSGLRQSLDERYLLKTAHSTVVRFKKPLHNKSAFLQELLKYRDFPFGTFEVKNIELVYNDWYHRGERVKQLYDFELG